MKSGKFWLELNDIEGQNVRIEQEFDIPDSELEEMSKTMIAASLLELEEAFVKRHVRSGIIFPISEEE